MREAMPSPVHFRGTGPDYSSCHIVVLAKREDRRRPDIHRLASRHIKRLRESVSRLPRQRGSLFSLAFALSNHGIPLLYTGSPTDDVQNIHAEVNSHLRRGRVLFAHAMLAFNRRSNKFSVEITRFPERRTARREFSNARNALRFFR